MRDVLAAVDAALAKYSWLDPNRLGVEGTSYGGQVADFIPTMTTRFKAAIPTAGVSNLVTQNYVSYYHDYLPSEYNGNFNYARAQRHPLESLGDSFCQQGDDADADHSRRERQRRAVAVQAEEYYIALKMPAIRPSWCSTRAKATASAGRRTRWTNSTAACSGMTSTLRPPRRPRAHSGRASETTGSGASAQLAPERDGVTHTRRQHSDTADPALLIRVAANTCAAKRRASGLPSPVWSEGWAGRFRQPACSVRRLSHPRGRDRSPARWRCSASPSRGRSNR